MQSVIDEGCRETVVTVGANAPGGAAATTVVFHSPAFAVLAL
jgi:hypothetical protein